MQQTTLLVYLTAILCGLKFADSREKQLSEVRVRLFNFYYVFFLFMLPLILQY